jgi:hypothetical protein
MEPTPETPATGAECAIPFEAEPEEYEKARNDARAALESLVALEEFPEAVVTVLDACDELGYQDRLTIASILVSDVTEEFEEDISTYMEETPAAEVDPYIVANTSQVVERLRVVSEVLATVSVEDGDGGEDDDEFDEGELTG